ncbi:MAG: hypothetical protein QGF68_03985 [Nitrospinota bacterium]|jgi:hypothetical protein|nr:hypothetical protein [Nitrospinota bacterium]MDP7385717.1 hypothetical protein [Nitrospinota bacterium]
MFMGITVAVGFAAFILNAILNVDIEGKMSSVIETQVKMSIKDAKSAAKSQIMKDLKGRR